MATTKIRFDSLSDIVGFQLRRASHAIQMAYEAVFEPLGLRISDVTVLIGVGENPGCTQADLSRTLGTKPANLVPIVAGLVNRGLVAREATEGRMVFLRLTDDGGNCLGQVHEAIQLQERRIAQLLATTDTDTEMILTAMRSIAKLGCKPHAA